MQAAETKGLEAAKNDAFGQITDQANRRGLFYSGIPIAEEQKYTGATFLPAVANLYSRYRQQRFNLQDALAKLTSEQYLRGQDIYQTELNRDAALRGSLRASGAGSASPLFGGRGGDHVGGGGGGQTLGASTTLRQQWQQEANAGDWNAQTLLNYVGDNNRFDGPVNSQSEYNILKQHGVIGNFYVRQTATRPATRPAIQPFRPSSVGLPAFNTINGR
jgi:hypothetical protein